MIISQTKYHISWCFNPAEAEEGFSSKKDFNRDLQKVKVSIQPKPKKGLVVDMVLRATRNSGSFNPAEAEEGFSS